MVGVRDFSPLLPALPVSFLHLRVDRCERIGPTPRPVSSCRRRRRHRLPPPSPMAPPPSQPPPPTAPSTQKRRRRRAAVAAAANGTPKRAPEAERWVELAVPASARVHMDTQLDDVEPAGSEPALPTRISPTYRTHRPLPPLPPPPTTPATQPPPPTTRNAQLRQTTSARGRRRSSLGDARFGVGRGRAQAEEAA